MKNRFLTRLGGCTLALPFLHLLLVDIPSSGTRWTPAAVLTASAYLANRYFLRFSWLYGAAAALLISIVVAEEFALAWVAVIWALLGVLALGARNRFGYGDLRIQSCLLAGAAFIRAWIVNLDVESTGLRIGTTSLVIAASYASQFLIRESGRIETSAKSYFSVSGTSLLTLLLFNEVEGRLLTLAYGVAGACLLIAGFIFGERILRLSGLMVFLLCIGKLFVYDVREQDTPSRILSFIVLGLMLLGASWAYTRFRDRLRRLL